MKLFQKKDNKGFSLVELIVVVAIMAVLMGILVPTLIKNVEKSKKQKDESAIEEIRSQMQNSLADEKYSSITINLTYPKSGNKIDIDDPTISGTAPTELTAYLKDVADNVDDYTFTSKAYKAATSVTFVIGNERVSVKVKGVTDSKFES